MREACERQREAGLTTGGGSTTRSYLPARRVERGRGRGRAALTLLFGLLLAAFCLLPAGCSLLARTSSGSASSPSAEASASNLLEVGAPAQPPVIPEASGELRIVSYNISWRSGRELDEIIKLLREDAEAGGAAIIGLQDVDRNKRRSSNVTTARQMADVLIIHYS